MKNPTTQRNNVLRTLLTGTCLLATTAAGTAFAQDADSNALFKKLDSNGDGQISQQEMQNLPTLVHQKKFDEADSNHDGKVSSEEFMAQVKQHAEHMFKRLDKNGDGMIEADEADQARGVGHHMSGDRVFRHMDNNDNGSVSRSEWDKAVAAWQARHHDNDDSGDSSVQSSSENN